ncbi:hypothetical protein LTR87_016628 [Friedmanniomyces endolithicus]|nr:hypothetical protein LTR87_016628 [Friedmanniomyces endolithicus]
MVDSPAMASVKSLLAGMGIEKFAGFLDAPHHDVHSAIDPAKVKLPSSYTVCIVGASRGIGAGVAHAYAHAGATGLILASRRVSGLEQTAAECMKINPNVHIEIIPCDITSDSSVLDLASKTKSIFGRLDVLVINSGFSGVLQRRVTETPSEDFIQATNVNYIGTFLCAKHFIPLLLSSEGGAKAIIAINSVASLIIRGPISSPQYTVSKTAQFRLMQTIHEEYNSTDGLLCYSIHPGAVASEMAHDSAPQYAPYLVDSPELCGAFSVWLSKDRSHEWLSGRLGSVNWDTAELDAKKDVVVEKDLLKLTIDV